MKLVLISDSHSWNKELDIPDGDILIHGGDLTRSGSKQEVKQALEWLSSLPHKHKVFIAGNHDFFFDSSYKAYTPQGKSRHSSRKFGTKEEIEKILSEHPDLIYLNDSFIEVAGMKIWGSPITPWFHDWAFNRERGEDILKHWKLMPEEFDILVTHGPPYGILDKTIRGGEFVGCNDLLQEIIKRKIKLHIFGHIHEGRGAIYKKINEKNDEMIFINASSIDENYDPFPKPYTIIETDNWEVLNGKR
jgi:Icc-related predicted phosphoesterase